jgi:hypothetical protein
MPEDTFHDLAGAFPLRPTTPDFERLREAIDIIERLQAGSHGWSANYRLEQLLSEMFGVKPTGPNVQEIIDRFVDSVSVGYIGTHRSTRNAPKNLVPEDRFADLVELMTNTWFDGVFVGILFQSLGGHRDNDEKTQTP